MLRVCVIASNAAAVSAVVLRLLRGMLKCRVCRCCLFFIVLLLCVLFTYALVNADARYPDASCGV